jgi:hypothetical protein
MILLNQKNNNRKPPSLLMDENNATSFGSPTVIPSQRKKAERWSSLKRSHYFFPFLCVLALSAGGLIIYGLPHSYTAGRTTTALSSAEGNVADGQEIAQIPIAETLTAPISPTHSEYTTLMRSSAVIVNDQPSALAKPVEVVRPAPAKTVGNAQIKPFVSLAQAPKPIIPGKEKSMPSSDIDVLIALMRYSEDGKSSKLIELQELLDKCPAPNTRPGIQCRQNICAQAKGDSTLCPDNR